MVIKKGGKKGKKGKKILDDNIIERALVFKDITEIQEYGQITAMLGNCRCDILCADGKNRLGHIRGNMRKKVYIKTGDIVLLSLREYQDDKCDIIYLYKLKESKKLKLLGELPENFKINDSNDLLEKNDEVDIGIDFEDEDDENTIKIDIKKDFEENFKCI